MPAVTLHQKLTSKTLSNRRKKNLDLKIQPLLQDRTRFLFLNRDRFAHRCKNA